MCPAFLVPVAVLCREGSVASISGFITSGWLDWCIDIHRSQCYLSERIDLSIALSTFGYTPTASALDGLLASKRTRACYRSLVVTS